MNKKLITVIFAIILVAVLSVVIAVNHKTSNSGAEQSYSSIEEANSAASFNLEHSDRLCGNVATGFEANSSTIEVQFGEAGYIRKTLGVTDNSGKNADFDETSEAEIKGKKVTFKGKNGKVYLAVWTYNNFAYTVSLNENGNGVSIEEMTEYIEATV